jgi:hypothetical protein
VSSVSSDVLEKVRRLLAQAESTPYEGEAGVFFAKAAELMARYGIEQALLSATRHYDEKPERRVIEIASPYSRAKAVLLHCVAEASGCKMFYSASRSTASADVFGFPSDLDSVEMLFTSLLLHAGTLLARVRASGLDGSTSSARRAFIIGYATRIEERLVAARAKAVADEEEANGSSVALVVRDRRSMVEAEANKQVPHARKTRIAARSQAGLEAGRRGADEADLGQPRIHSRLALPA